MKRTKNIYSVLSKRSPKLSIKKLAFAISTLTIAACSSKEEMIMVTNVDECESKTNLSQADCEKAYEKALSEAERTGPKYSKRTDCEYEFGANNCTQTSNSLFMPFMSGFLVAKLFDSNRYYGGYQPVYGYYGSSRYSSPNRYVFSDGSNVGKPGASSYKVSSSNLKSKPTVTRTVSRGGFGSKASAKSSWGGGKSSWGG